MKQKDHYEPIEKLSKRLSKCCGERIRVIKHSVGDIERYCSNCNMEV